MRVYFLSLFLLLSSSINSFGQKDIRLTMGLAPQYIFQQAFKLDFERQVIHSLESLNSIKVSPIIYKGENRFFFRNSPNMVNGFGIDVSLKKGNRFDDGKFTLFWELGGGYHHIVYKYQGIEWIETVNSDGTKIITGEDAEIREVINRFDIFLLLNARIELLYFNDPVLNFYMGPQLRNSFIKSNTIPRTHRGTLQHGSNGVFLRAGMSVEWILWKNFEYKG